MKTIYRCSKNSAATDDDEIGDSIGENRQQRERDRGGYAVTIDGLKRTALMVSAMAASLALTVGQNGLHAREMFTLTRESAIERAMASSYNIRQLELGVERSRMWLKAEQAGLKSRVYLNLRLPEFDAVAETKWNSTLQKDEIVRQNTRRWQAQLSVRQPVVLLGYPTNGYLSANNRIYRYLQKEDEGEDVDYYNRLFVEFNQPFLLPNELKNDIEEAELDLEQRELRYIRDRVNLASNISYNFYNLYRRVHREDIYGSRVENLERVTAIAEAFAAADSSRAIEATQARVELANARERYFRNRSDLRMEKMEMKQRLRMTVEDSLIVLHDISITPFEIDPDNAVRQGSMLHPQLRILEINRRKQEIDLNNTKGFDAFHLELNMTYGLEKNHDRYQAMWEEYNNSYSISLSAYIPIWDWGRRESRIEAERIGLRQRELSIEETRISIRSDIMTTITDLEDYQSRALNLEESVKKSRGLIDASISQYQNGVLSLQGLLQVLDRQAETEINFLEAYLGYRRTLQSLESQTCYDYEREQTLLDIYAPGKGGI